MLRFLRLALVAALLPIAAASQSAATDPGCVTHAEFQSVKKGMTREHVERQVFKVNRSWAVSGGAGGYSRSYQSCDRQHAAIVEYGVRARGGVARASGFKVWTEAS